VTCPIEANLVITATAMFRVRAVGFITAGATPKSAIAAR